MLSASFRIITRALGSTERGKKTLRTVLLNGTTHPTVPKRDWSPGLPGPPRAEPAHRQGALWRWEGSGDAEGLGWQQVLPGLPLRLSSWETCFESCTSLVYTNIILKY